MADMNDHLAAAASMRQEAGGVFRHRRHFVDQPPAAFKIVVLDINNSQRCFGHVMLSLCELTGNLGPAAVVGNWRK